MYSPVTVVVEVIVAGGVVTVVKTGVWVPKTPELPYFIEVLVLRDRLTVPVGSRGRGRVFRTSL